MLIHAGDNTISKKPQYLVNSLFFLLNPALRTPTLGLLLSEGIVYVQFVCLYAHLSPVMENKEKTDIQEQIGKKEGFCNRDLFYWRIVIKVNSRTDEIR